MRGMQRGIVAMLVVGLMGAALAAAQDKPKERPKDKPDKPKEDNVAANIQVWAIRATTKNKEVDPALRELADKLKRDFKFTGFKLEDRKQGAATTEKPYAGELIGGYSVKITPKRNEGKKVQLEVAIQGPKSLKATVTVNAGEYQPLGGLPLDGGDQLIVAVSAR